MTNETVIFENEGLIDIRAIKTFGVNVKETKNPFGYFGTGLKYAIAILLRNHCKITIHRGLETYKFALVKTEIRGEEFSIITMNGEELGFTSQLGKNWELWQAYRELYCNTLDEGGQISISTTPNGLEFVNSSKTVIAVSGEAFTAIHYKRREFILQSDPIEVIEVVEIHEGPGTGFFFKNIYISGLSKKSRFRYNILDQVRLTEDRTLASLFNAEWELVRAILHSKNESIIKATVTASDEYFESELHFDYCAGKPGPVFLKVIAELLSDYSIQINDSAVARFKKYATEEKSSAVAITTVQELQLAKAKNFCTKLGLFTEKFPVVVVESLGKGILGSAKDQTIYLALETFEMGTKMVAITLIEEYLHLDKGYADMTRAMQNHLFNKIISLGEELVEEPL